jgi:hypothetical protein
MRSMKAMLIELNLLKIWKAIMLATLTPHNPELRIIDFMESSP